MAQVETHTTETTGVKKTVAAETGTHEATTDESVLGSLGINGQLFAFQLLNFAIVGGIVWFMILRPLVKKMEERRVLIAGSLDKAKEVETALAMSEIKFQERIDEAKVEANKIAERARKDADAAVADMKQKAKREIQMLIEQAKRNIQIERDEAMGAVRKEAADLIVGSLQSLLPGILDEKKDRKIIDDTIARLQ
jgi:F-type H+-transporting ATPase subunit b